MRLSLGSLLFLLLVVPATAQTPIAHWKFDDGITVPGTMTAAESINFNNGSWAGDPGALSWTDQTGGVIGGAAHLTTRGVEGNHFDVDAIPQLAGLDQMTISAWINPETQATGYTGVFTARRTDNQENWGLAIEGSNPYRIDGRANGRAGYGVDGNGDPLRNIFADDANTNTQGVDTGGWYHLVQVWDGLTESNITFVDGVQARPTSESGIPSDSSTLVNPWRIGDDKCCGGREYRGLIDDLSMFDVALDPTQVEQLYLNGLAGLDAAGNVFTEFLDGDVNLDNLVDLVDFEIIRDNFYMDVTTREEGDLTADGFVDFDDFDQWKTAAGALGEGVFIPEPAGMSLAWMALLGLMTLRRNRRA
ncbi:MAG: LamG domain-containing protein [Planctomycetota bacterium]